MSSKTPSQAQKATSSTRSAKFNPAAQVFKPFTQKTQSSSPDAPTADKTLKTVEEGDIGCPLCDEGLWCPMCGSDDASKPVLDQPRTPVTAKTGAELAKFHKTPGHELEAEQTAPKQYGKFDGGQNMKARKCNWPAVKQRIDTWLGGVEGGDGEREWLALCARPMSLLREE